MTDADLTAAVALIEGNYAHYGEWKPGSFTDGLPFDERAAAAIATILQAVATGEMVVKPTSSWRLPMPDFEQHPIGTAAGLEVADAPA